MAIIQLTTVWGGPSFYQTEHIVDFWGVDPEAPPHTPYPVRGHIEGDEDTALAEKMNEEKQSFDSRVAKWNDKEALRLKGKSVIRTVVTIGIGELVQEDPRLIADMIRTASFCDRSIPQA